jgi:predicted GNAT family acetyltransferase
VRALVDRQRALGKPPRLEWVQELTPALLDPARAAGMTVLETPLMVLDRAAWRAPDAPGNVVVRLLDADDDALAASQAVVTVAFAAPGTAAGPEGVAERDAAVADGDPGALKFIRERVRGGLTVVAVAESAHGPVAVGSAQPVGDVAEVIGVATLPAVRRQGLGGAVTGALVEHALAGGAAVVFLAAGSEAVARVYARLGFRRIGTYCFARLAA